MTCSRVKTQSWPDDNRDEVAASAPQPESQEPLESIETRSPSPNVVQPEDVQDTVSIGPSS